MSRLSLSLSSVLITLRYAARLLFVPLEKVRVRVKSSGVIVQRGTALPIQLQLARADKHGKPAQPQEPEDAQGALPHALGLPEKDWVSTYIL